MTMLTVMTMFLIYLFAGKKQIQKLQILQCTLDGNDSLRFGATYFGIAILKSVAAMAVVGVEREIPPRGNLLRSGKTGAQQMAGAGTLYPEQTVHLRAFVVTLYYRRFRREKQ